MSYPRFLLRELRMGRLDRNRRRLWRLSATVTDVTPFVKILPSPVMTWRCAFIMPFVVVEMDVARRCRRTTCIIVAGVLNWLAAAVAAAAAGTADDHSGVSDSRSKSTTDESFLEPRTITSGVRCLSFLDVGCCSDSFPTSSSFSTKLASFSAWRVRCRSTSSSSMLVLWRRRSAMPPTS